MAVWLPTLGSPLGFLIIVIKQLPQRTMWVRTVQSLWFVSEMNFKMVEDVLL